MKKQPTPQPNPEVARLKAENSQLRKDWMAAIQENGKNIGPAMEVEKFKKQIEIIQHIAAGRKDDAILCLLDPIQMLFHMDVHFADDKTHMAFQQETLDKCKDLLAETLKTIQLKPKPPNEQPKALHHTPEAKH